MNTPHPLNRITLSFTEKETEKEFQQLYFKNSLIHFRYTYSILIILFGIFSAIDLIIAPDFYYQFLAIRLVVCSTMGIVLFLSFFDFFEKMWQYGLAASFLVTGIGATLMILKFPTDYVYNLSLILIYMVVYGVVKQRFIISSISGFLLLIFYNILVYIYVEDAILFLINSNTFLLSVNILGWFSVYQLEKYQRKNFANIKTLESQNKRIEQANKLLEFKIKRRTESLSLKNQELQDIINTEKSRDKALTDEIEQLNRVNNLQKSYIQKLGYDLRTPLSAIVGFSELLSSKHKEEEIHRYSQCILEGSNQLSAILRDILLMLEIENKSLNYIKESIPLHQLLVEVSDSINTSINDSSTIELCEPRLKVLSIFEDRNILSLIFKKLLTRTCAQASSPLIKFGYSHEKSNLNFFIKFKANPDIIAQNDAIFNLAPQNIDSTNVDYEIQLIQSLVKLMGGTFGFTRDEDEAVFTISIAYQEGKLNLADFITNENEITKQPKLETSNTLQKQILIAEDNDLNFDFYNIVLSQEYMVIRAKNGLDAIDKFLNYNLDLILMDIKMPIMGGVEATQKIRTYSSSIPIIAFTAFEHTEFETQNFVDYLVKPISSSDLLAKVKKHIGKNSQTRNSSLWYPKT